MGSGLNFLQSHERFIPVGLGAMCAKMLEDPRLTAAERTQLQEFFAMAAARFHFEFHRGLQELKAAYAPFDPTARFRARRRRSPTTAMDYWHR